MVALGRREIRLRRQKRRRQKHTERSKQSRVRSETRIHKWQRSVATYLIILYHKIMNTKDIKIKKLKNGLTVIFHNYPNFNSVFFNVIVKVGSRFESKNNNGVSHLIEHLLVKEVSDKYKNGRWLKNYLNEDLVGYTFKDRTEYEITGHKLDADKVIDGFFQALANISFCQKNIKTEKEIILEEIAEEISETGYSFKKFVDGILFGQNSMSLNILGSRKSVKIITKKELGDFYRAHYCFENMIVSFSGDIDEKKVLKKLEKYSLLPAREIKDESKSLVNIKRGIFFTTEPSKDRVWVSIFLPWPSLFNANKYIEREFVVSLLRQYLFDWARDKGYCYSIDVSLLVLSDYADLEISASLDYKKFILFSRELLKRLNRFPVEVGSQDLRQAKENRLKVFDMDADYPKHNMNEAAWSYFVFNTTLSLTEKKKISNSLSLADVRRILQKILNTNERKTIIAGRFSEEEKKEIKKIYL